MVGGVAERLRTVHPINSLPIRTNLRQPRAFVVENGEVHKEIRANVSHSRDEVLGRLPNAGGPLLPRHAEPRRFHQEFPSSSLWTLAPMAGLKVGGVPEDIGQVRVGGNPRG